MQLLSNEDKKISIKFLCIDKSYQWIRHINQNSLGYDTMHEINQIILITQSKITSGNDVVEANQHTRDCTPFVDE